MHDLSATPPNMMLEEEMDQEFLAISKMPIRERVS